MKYIHLRKLLNAWANALHCDSSDEVRTDISKRYYQKVYLEMCRQLGKGRRIDTDKQLNAVFNAENYSVEIKLQEVRRILLESGFMTLMYPE